MNNQKKEIPYRMWRANNAVVPASGSRVKRVVYIIPQNKAKKVQKLKEPSLCN